MPSRKVFVDLGAFDGDHTVKAVRGGEFDTCIMVEANPQQWKACRKVAARLNCTFLPHAVWDQASALPFHHSHIRPVASSIYAGGAHAKGNTTWVAAFDIAGFFREYLRPSDDIVVRMVLEGAQYRVMRRLITTGLACWMNATLFMGGAMYNVRNFQKLPLDMAFDWLLRGCDRPVNVVSENNYHFDNSVLDLWRQNAAQSITRCVHCPFLFMPILEEQALPFVASSCFDGCFTRKRCCDVRNGTLGRACYVQSDHLWLNMGAPVYATSEGYTHQKDKFLKCCKNINSESFFDGPSRTFPTNLRTARTALHVARNVILEFGSEDGQWTAEHMQSDSFDLCFLVDADPNRREILHNVAENHKCTFLAQAVSDQTGIVKGDTTMVSAFDVAEFFTQNLGPNDSITIRMDLGVMRYRVMRRLITRGLACWISKLEVVGDTKLGITDFDKMPLDPVFDWVLRGCDVPVDIQWSIQYSVHPDVANFYERRSGAFKDCWHCPLLWSYIPDDLPL